jgi:hypothetical protein
MWNKWIMNFFGSPHRLHTIGSYMEYLSAASEAPSVCRLASIHNRALFLLTWAFTSLLMTFRRTVTPHRSRNARLSSYLHDRPARTICASTALHFIVTLNQLVRLFSLKHRAVVFLVIRVCTTLCRHYGITKPPPPKYLRSRVRCVPFQFKRQLEAHLSENLLRVTMRLPVCPIWSVCSLVFRSLYTTELTSAEFPSDVFITPGWRTRNLNRAARQVSDPPLPIAVFVLYGGRL